jgi:hypothetical protein
VDRQKDVLQGILDIGPIPVVAGRDGAKVGRYSNEQPPV